MSQYAYKNVLVEIKDGIAWLTMNRPEKRNAMSPDLHREMDDALDRLETDDAAKVIVLSGAGGNFSSGQDLKTFFRDLDGNPHERRRVGRIANRWRWERLYEYDKPTIAMVEGYCVGGAFMQLLATDFAVAADDATFSLAEVNWGILPGALVAKAVTDTVLPRHALYYCCLGDPFDGNEAARIGMINDQFRSPKGQAEGCDDQSCGAPDEEKLRDAAGDKASCSTRAHNGLHASV
jgi:feruloyl-CoA hydratase/lyase